MDFAIFSRIKSELWCLRFDIADEIRLVVCSYVVMNNTGLFSTNGLVDINRSQYLKEH